MSMEQTESPPMSPTLASLLLDFDDWPQEPPIAAIEAARAHRSEIETPLVDFLRESLGKLTQEDGKVTSQVFHVLLLLSEFRTPDARPVIFELLRLPAAALDYLFAEEASSCLADLLVTWDATPDELCSLLTGADVAPCSRVAAARALMSLASRGEVGRNEVAAGLEQLLRDIFDSRIPACGDSELMESLRSWEIYEFVYALADCGLPKSRELIEEAYAAGYVKSEILPKREAIRIHARAVTGAFSDRQWELDRITDAVDCLQDSYAWKSYASDPFGKARLLAEIGRLAGEAETAEEEQEEEPYFEPGKTLTRETQKVGRNDPCPCRSGKKYKKCCGHADRLIQ
jgi:hypothetical protein